MVASQRLKSLLFRWEFSYIELRLITAINVTQLNIKIAVMVAEFYSEKQAGCLFILKNRQDAFLSSKTGRMPVPQISIKIDV
jgi:hypothetical protein